MSQSESDPGSEVVREVLNYFVRNPKAADSLEGVARWRLVEGQVHRKLQEIAAALTFLVSQGLLEEVTTSGATKVFRLPPARMADAIQFLTQSGSAQQEES